MPILPAFRIGTTLLNSIQKEFMLSAAKQGLGRNAARRFMRDQFGIGFSNLSWQRVLSIIVRQFDAGRIAMELGGARRVSRLLVPEIEVLGQKGYFNVQGSFQSSTFGPGGGERIYVNFNHPGDIEPTWDEQCARINEILEKASEKYEPGEFGTCEDFLPGDIGMIRYKGIPSGV